MNRADTGDLEQYLKVLCAEFERNTKVPPEAYENYGVKRGLRNADGTGVMAGVTFIGSVQGYFMRDGERVPAPGQLFYRGINVEEIVDGFRAEGRQGFCEAAYLLLLGRLPNWAENDRFFSLLHEYSPLPTGFAQRNFVPARNCNLMNRLARCVLALYDYDERPEDLSLPNMMRQCVRLIASFPSIVASSYAANAQYYDHEQAESLGDGETLSVAENFLRRLRPDGRYTKEEAELLDLCLVLHCEHGGGNNSAFTARVLASSATDTYSVLSGAICSLKGPLHGGANIKVMEMLDDIKAHIRDPRDDDEIARYLKSIILKEAGDRSGKIYGMGHAVYTLSDPRAVILKRHARELAASRPAALADLNMLEAVERLAPRAFLEAKGDSKVLGANVDLYSGLVYQMLDIPRELFTPLFAIARVCGWAAHRIEETMTGGRIIRPAYKAIGEMHSYVAMADRA